MSVAGRVVNGSLPALIASRVSRSDFRSRLAMSPKACHALAWRAAIGLVSRSPDAPDPNWKMGPLDWSWPVSSVVQLVIAPAKGASSDVKSSRITVTASSILWARSLVDGMGYHAHHALTAPMRAPRRDRGGRRRCGRLSRPEQPEQMDADA